MDIRFDMSAFRQSIAAQKEKIEKATRPAAQAGAQVVYEGARIRVPVSGKEHYFYGSSYKKTGQKYGPYAPGNLRDSVYQAFSQDNSTPTKVTYHISFNHKKAPYGFMVHDGTSKTSPHPFIVQAVHDDGPRALEAMKTRFVQEMAA